MRAIKVKESVTETVIDVMSYVPHPAFLLLSVAVLGVFAGVFAAVLAGQFAFLDEFRLPWWEEDISWDTRFLAFMLGLLALLPVIIAWINALCSFLRHEKAHLRTDKTARELHLSKQSWVPRVDFSKKIPLSAIRKVWFERIGELCDRYAVGLDLEGKDRNMIIDRDLNKGEKQSLTLALERSLGVKAEVKQFWEVIDEGPPLVIAIFGTFGTQLVGLEESIRLMIDENANLMSMVRPLEEEKVPISAVKQVWLQCSTESSGTFWDMGLDLDDERKEIKIAQAGPHHLTHYEDSIWSLAQTLAGAVGVKTVLRKGKLKPPPEIQVG